MSEDPVSRRAALKVLGVGVAGATSLKSAPLAAAPSPDDLSSAEPASELIAPLGAGSTLGHWRIERVLPLEHGVMSVVLCDAEDRRFQLDVCARDLASDAMRGPGETEHFQIFLANRGDGSLGTHEDHGLCAMALAEVIKTNEARVSRAGFVTLAERLRAESARVHVD